ncbi:MAG: DEAD/DEAH box helicase, partial [Synechococcus sp.]
MAFAGAAALEVLRAAGFAAALRATFTLVVVAFLAVVFLAAAFLGAAFLATARRVDVVLAFTLPVLQRLNGSESRRRRKRARTLILTPTRELAIQVAEAAAAYNRQHSAALNGTEFGRAWIAQWKANKTVLSPRTAFR